MKRTLTYLFALVGVAGSYFQVSAADTPPGASLVRNVEWQKEPLAPDVKLNAGAPGGGNFITIQHTEKKPVSVPLWQTKQPGIATKCYALRGKIRYHDVEGTGYLDLWSSFSGTTPGEPNAKYFSRTLAERGPLQRISGNSEWRNVQLPFDGTSAKASPSGLELNLVLAGSGSVDITDLQLLQFADAGSMWSALGTASAVSWQKWILRWLYGSAIALVVLIVGGAILWRVKSRRNVELRKMRAMDLV